MIPSSFKDSLRQIIYVSSASIELEFYIQRNYPSRIKVKLRHFHEGKLREFLGIWFSLKEQLKEVFQTEGNDSRSKFGVSTMIIPCGG